MKFEELGAAREPVITNVPMIDKYIANATSLGVPFNDGHLKNDFFASTDFGNVSKVIPSIHPVFKIKADAPNHNAGFTKSTFDPVNQPPTLNSAKSMAMTAIDIACEEGLLAKIKEDFKLSKQ